MPLTDLQLAYVAGIIDGEGCIRTNNNISKQPVIRVHVTNTRLDLILKLKEWFGGYTWINETHKYNPKAKASHIWEVSAKQAASFLTAILPYLFLKREQAELVLALQATKKTGNNVSLDIQCIRTGIVNRLHELNQKGVVAISHS